MTAQIERTLQTEIAWRLKAYPCLYVPIPNGTYLPARTDAERAIVARVINRMKADGQLVPGSPDAIVMSAKGALCLEMKRPRTRDLLTTRPKGRLSPEQKDFRERCERVGVRYTVAHCWADVESSLWGLW